MKTSDLISEKLNDTQLRKNLHFAMDMLQTNRKKLIKDRYRDWETLREEGRKVKQNTLSRLPELLEKFEANATKNGMQVHWASNAEEANEIIFNLAKKNNITKILKGKSMASEEIHLNAYLKKRGVQALETDLGEIIIQLIDEPPVHIVVPAIHKNRYEIGKIFEEHLKVERYSKPEDLNSVARTYLRKEFQEFKMGITGVNFAIAQDGAIWLLENEGNGRMSTTASDIHVAICGIEKIVESFDDAIILDTLLVPSATGQSITCYNNIITSPRKEGDLDGPKEVHIILLDHHRSDILSHKHYSKALSCIRCGTCMNHCPVYDKVGGHAYGATYPGPIGEVISPQIFGIDTYGYILNLCSLCGRCSEVCPVKIPLAEMIRDLRSEKVGQGSNANILGISRVKPKIAEKIGFKIFAFLASKPWAWRLMLWNVRLFGSLGKPFASMIPMLKQWTSCRSYPDLDASFQPQNIKGVIYE
ncbi:MULTISPECIES: LutB/LldF family L-lactate oxidation iron-sulfur protein [unclassified Helicobacter]|uniref:LutB/LldF family L-lactate oxidation iron-sulfur protein n=1 Tax=unclassified Helicobacter TaxID=2593540 RepID=UPI000CF043C6|nr:MULTISPECIES: LutB/LldF family L-lactate oxidation iron-sulfur protein [unclassified Helicobacter]